MWCGKISIFTPTGKGVVICKQTLHFICIYAYYTHKTLILQVEEKNGRTKKIKTINSEDFIITNSTWRSNKKKSDNVGNEYSEHFIRKAVLTNDGIKVENDDSESASEGVTKDVFKMTDEELFKACEGRTAHK